MTPHATGSSNRDGLLQGVGQFRFHDASVDEVADVHAALADTDGVGPAQGDLPGWRTAGLSGGVLVAIFAEAEQFVVVRVDDEHAEEARVGNQDAAEAIDGEATGVAAAAVAGQRSEAGAASAGGDVSRHG